MMIRVQRLFLHCTTQAPERPKPLPLHRRPDVAGAHAVTDKTMSVAIAQHNATRLDRGFIRCRPLTRVDPRSRIWDHNPAEFAPSHKRPCGVAPGDCPESHPDARLGGCDREQHHH